MPSLPEALFLTASLANAVAAWCAWRRAKSLPRAGLWLAFSAGFGGLAIAEFHGHAIVLPAALKTTIDSMLGPVTLSLGSLMLLVVLYLTRRFFVVPGVAWTVLNVSWLWLGASLGDSVFADNVLQPDNLPVVVMVYLLAGLIWLGAARAVQNDGGGKGTGPCFRPTFFPKAASRGRKMDQSPQADEAGEKVLVWPDLVYSELICTLLVLALLVAWSMLVRAPLEQPANPAVTPNPAKAPWYFLGFQELLVYSDTWFVGVAVPCLIVLGLAAIPYLDRNPRGSGYYTIRQRQVAYAVFMFGFLMLWILPILIGTFLRGPNWSFFGPYEVRDPQKLAAVANVKLSELFWGKLLGRGLPAVPAGSTGLGRLGHVVWREIAGVALLGVYFVALPPLLGRTLLRPFRQDMGRWRYLLMTLLLLVTILLPLKMILRWTLGLSYIVSMPEYLLNL